MNRRWIAAALCGALAAAPALAQDQPAAAPKPPRDKKVCRSEIVTGSMMRQSTCHTKAEWTDIDARNQRNVDDATSTRGSGRANSPNGS